MQQRDNRFMRQRRPESRGRLPHHRSAPSRGNARQKYESYLAKAREAQLAGDAVEMDNCYQHAEHYWRIMRAAEAAPGERAGKDQP